MFFQLFYICVEFAWRQWPDDTSYSIPMSVYGCPEQSVNKWAQGYLDVKNRMESDSILMEKTLGPLLPEKNLFTMGPFQSDGFRLSFCSKRAQFQTRELNRDKEWPLGNYAILKQNMSSPCPEGKTHV